MSLEKSYPQILKASSMVGGGQLFRMLIGIVQTKFVAILLGTAGVGLIGAYQSIIQLSSQLSGLGINQSGVRDVASAAGTNDQQAVARTVLILNRMCWLTGLIGTIVLSALAIPISQVTFGGNEHAVALMLLSSVVLMTLITQGQMAVIQGLRRIGDLVRLQIYGSIAGAIVSITLYSTIGMSGIVPSLLAIALFNLGTAWWYSRKLFSVSISMSWQETFAGTKSLVGLGISFMISGLATTFTSYVARALIVQDIGIDGLGIYQAAFAVSGYVLNFVLGAMAADFYPRLAGVADNREEMCCLVNEQTEIGLLLATPALVATIGFAPFIINLLYSSNFASAVELLRWFAIGCFLRVISWPMGFVQLAKGEKYWFIFSEILFNTIHICFIFIGIHYYGLYGTGIAFFAMYVLYVFGIHIIAAHLIGFSWSQNAKKLILTQVLIVLISFCASFMLSEFWNIIVGGVLFVVISLYCLRQLLVRLGRFHKI
ncbi:MAG: O-antigen translocase [Desulfamplus sp.]|nr:O-antigen translocase [Desulfamplus sp.]